MDNQTIAALIAAGGAVVVAVPAMYITRAANRISSDLKKLERSKAERELFEAFNARFDSMNEDLNAISKDDFVERDVYIGQRKRTAENVAQDYLNLCSEEYLWHTRAMIGEDIWNVWMKGIIHYLNRPNTVIAAVFSREMVNAADCYYGLFDCAPIAEPLKMHESLYK